MKKILLLTENFPPIEGGSGRWFWELYTRLPAENIIVCTHDVEHSMSVDTSTDLKIIRMPLKCSEWGVKSLQGLKFYWSCFRKIRKIVIEDNIDEIHCGRVIHEGVTAWLLKLLTGIPYRCFVHGEDIETVATSREQSLLVKLVCKRASSLVCNSYNSKNLVEKFGFTNSEKCDVLHPGVDTTKFLKAPSNEAVRQRFGWGKGKLVLLTVGRLQQRKGQDFLVKAMPALLQIFPNLHYAIVGRGEEKEHLISLIDDLELNDSVTLHTDMDDEDLVNAYQQCDIFILPNRTINNDIEGFGMVLVEAQACGKPVIAGNSGGTSETMLERETGVIIDCSSKETILRELPDAIHCCRSLDHEKIYCHAHSCFNWERHTKEFLVLID
jgi:phosphatidylinositol alpha-1,6-mannosyltransferase